MSSNHLFPESYSSKESKEKQLNQNAKVFWFYGLSGSGKSTYAKAIEKSLMADGYKVAWLDGDNLRSGLNCDLKFSLEDRSENLRRAAEVAKIFTEMGLITIAAFITPLEKNREEIKKIIGHANFVDILVDTPIEVCKSRDTKNLYVKAKEGLIPNFTGVSSPFEQGSSQYTVPYTSKNGSQSLHELMNFILNKLTD